MGTGVEHDVRAIYIQTELLDAMGNALELGCGKFCPELVPTGLHIFGRLNAVYAYLT
jgi:hypothetical protein